MTRMRKRRGKRGKSNLASNQFPIFSPQSGTLREVHRVPKRREEGGRRCDQEEWKGSQKERERDYSSL